MGKEVRGEIPTVPGAELCHTAWVMMWALPAREGGAIGRLLVRKFLLSAIFGFDIMMLQPLCWRCKAELKKHSYARMFVIKNT